MRAHVILTDINLPTLKAEVYSLWIVLFALYLLFEDVPEMEGHALNPSPQCRITLARTIIM